MGARKKHVDESSFAVGRKVKVLATGEVKEMFDLGSCKVTKGNSPNGVWCDNGVGELPLNFYMFNELELLYD